MPSSVFIESGTEATQDFQFWTSSASDTGGAITSDAQSLLGSLRSIKAAAGASPGGATVSKDAVLADAGRRISFAFRFSGTINGAGAGADFINTYNSGFANKIFALGLTNAGKLVLFDVGASDTVLGTGSTTLLANTDYRISIAYTLVSTTINTFSVFLNGNLEITVTNGTLTRVGSAAFSLGVFAHNSPGANVTFYFAHIYADDGNSADIGNVKVIAKRPNANGTANNFATQIGSGGSGYGSGHSPQVNERPLSTTNGWSVVAVGATTEEYNIQGKSVGDFVILTQDRILDYVGWVSAKALISETASIIVNGVSTNISLTSTITLFTKIAGSSTYPAGTGADIGIITDATATTVSLYEAGIVVAFIPAIKIGSMLTMFQ